MQRNQITTKKEKEDIFLVAKSAYKEIKAETAVSVLFPWCALTKFAWLIVLIPPFCPSGTSSTSVFCLL
jgi:hypothetical protein